MTIYKCVILVELVIQLCSFVSLSLCDRVSLHLLSILYIGDPDAQSRNMSTGDENQPAPTASVTSVSLKIPPFWPADPQIWFAQVEAQFQTRNITSQKTKYEYIVASLSPEFATEVRDLVLTVPDTNPYDKLKTVLIGRTTTSEQRRLQQLLNSEELGDRKPSQLLRRMQQLLGVKATTIDQSFLRELFIQRLPPNVRMVLASTDKMTLTKLAELADKVVEATTLEFTSTASQPTVSPISILPEVKSELSQLWEEIDHLKKPFHSSYHGRSQSRSRGRPRSITPSRHPTATQPTLCWYHQQFSEAAKKCRQPCSYQGNDPASH